MRMTSLPFFVACDDKEEELGSFRLRPVILSSAQGSVRPNRSERVKVNESGL